MRSVSELGNAEESPAAVVRIQLLGLFRITVGKRVVPEQAWRLRKAAGLIKLLALAPDHRLHREQLFESLWPEMGPDAADNNLRRTLHHARRSLEPQRRGSTYLVWRGEQLELSSPSGVIVDVLAFEQAAASARRVQSVDRYQAALALYGGELLPEDRYEDWAIARRESLQRLYLSLLVELAQLHERRQERERALAAYQRVATLDPLHEEARKALMRLYALAGQRGRALQEYRHLAQALGQELGVEPDVTTQRLRDEIRSNRYPPPGLRVESHVATPRTNLPFALTSFVGREAERAAVERMLQTRRLVTLIGPGGSGKTRLGFEVARSLTAEYADGVWLVELAPLSEPGLLAETVIKALSLTELPGLSAEQSLIKHLQSRNLLLVVDNCEHLSDAVAQLIDTLLRRAPGLRILTTSRQALEIMGEALFPVPPLGLPDELEADIDPLTFDAIRLFVERAMLVRQEFRLTAANSATIVHLCRRLDGLPLAIELAAARLHSLSVEEVAAGLDDRFSLLTRGNRTALPRQQTLRAVMAWSNALLSESEQRLFRRLALFSGGVSTEAVESVCNFNGDIPIGMRDGLGRLADKSLLIQGEDRSGERRVTMLETVQAYAQEQLVLAGEAERFSRVHAHYFLALAEAAARELNGPQQVIWFAQLDAEHDNLRAALRWAEATAEGQTALRLSAALWRFWLTRSYFGEGQAWCTRALALAGEQRDTSLRATVLKGAGALSYRQGDYGQARILFEQALRVARRIGDDQSIAELMNNQGLVAQALGQYAEARRFYEESLALTEALGDWSGMARTLNNQGLAAIFQTDYGLARRLLTQALALARQTGNRSSEDNTLNNLGMLAIHEAAYEEARVLNEERLALARQLGNKYGIASALHNLGFIAGCQGDDVMAEARFQESLAIARETGDKGITAAALQNLGVVAARRGAYSSARSLYWQSLVITSEIRERYVSARTLEQLAMLAAMEGEALRAARYGGAAEAMRQAINAPQPPVDRAEYKRAITEAQSRVAQEAWADAWMQGRAMSVEEVLAELA